MTNKILASANKCLHAKLKFPSQFPEINVPIMNKMQNYPSASIFTYM